MWAFSDLGVGAGVIEKKPSIPIGLTKAEPTRNSPQLEEDGALRKQTHPNVRKRQADKHHPPNQNLVVREEMILNIALSLSLKRFLLSVCDVPGTVLGRAKESTENK